MRTGIRLLAVMIFPLCYLASGFASTINFRGWERPMDAANVADLGGMLLVAVAIYLVSLLFARRTLRDLTVGELAAGSLLVALLAPALIGASIGLLYVLSVGGNSQVADYAFFFVVPFVPPVVACWLALRIVLAWHRRRPRHIELPEQPGRSLTP